VECPVGGWHKAPLARWETQDDVDVGAGQEVRDEALLVFERGDDRGIDPVGVEVDDGCADLPCGPARDPVDIGRDDVGSRPQFGLLLTREVVVEPVDDEDGDEDERQRDDADEAERQARLEGPGRELPQKSRQPAPGGRVSVRRTRSRPLGPS
jgi:hypothetical protein